MAEASAALLYPKTCAATFACRQCQHSAQVVFHDPDAFAEDEPIGGRSRWMQEAAMEQALRKLHDKSRRRCHLYPVQSVARSMSRRDDRPICGRRCLCWRWCR